MTQELEALVVRSTRHELCQMNDQLQRLISLQAIAPPSNGDLFAENPELGPAFRVMRDLPVVEQLAFLRVLVQQCSVSQIERSTTTNA
jgi:hypothetical protein